MDFGDPSSTYDSPKMIGFFNSILGIHRPLIRFVNVKLRELPCFKEPYKVFTT